MDNKKIIIWGSIITIGVLFFTIMTIYRIYEINKIDVLYDVPTLKKDTPVLNKDVTLYLFHGKECPACNNALELMPDDFKNINIEIKTYEVWHNPDNSILLDKVGDKINYQVRNIPFFIVGSEYNVGYNFQELKNKIDKYSNQEYNDIVLEVINENPDLNVISEKLK